MEISNTQFGQNIAQSNSAQNLSEQIGVAQESNLAREIAANTVVETQENSTQADSEDRNSSSEERSIEEAVQEVQEFVQTQARNLAFDIDDSTNRSIVTVSDTESGEVIRQIPSDEVLQLAERIQSLQQDIGASVGVFVNREV